MKNKYKKMLAFSITAIAALNLLGNTTANAKPKDPNYIKTKNEVLANPNMKKLEFPIYRNTYDSGMVSYDRALAKKLFLDGIPFEIYYNGLTASYNFVNSKKTNRLPKGWTLKNHPELNIVFNNDINRLASTKHGDSTGKYDFISDYVNIYQLYRDLYHIDLNKLVTKNRPQNWQTKYKYVSPKTYMLDGYKKFVPLSNSELKAKAKTINGIRERFSDNVHGPSFKPTYFPGH